MKDGTFANYARPAPDLSLDVLAAIVASLPTGRTTWNGEVKLNTMVLPYRPLERCPMCGGDGLTSDGLDTCWKCDGRRTVQGDEVHAVVVDRVLFVSRQAWEALKE